ncbi:hypothetical protein [Nocardia wallacei]|uniref:hypothetical protein n=1 Tax=Nocardia wallacei TaxID=480035 RepID=UPI002457BBE1|nr:hypothetical protein [Nocardia wallacei]
MAVSADEVTEEAVTDDPDDGGAVHDTEIEDATDTVGDPDATEPVTVERPARRRARTAVLAVALVVVIAGTVMTVLSGLAWRDARAADQRDKEVLSTASAMAVNLVTLRHASAKDDLARVEAGTTGAFHEQFAGAADGFGELLTQGGVESTGQVASAGIVTASDSAATVLAAVTSTVKNNEAPQGEIRVYRMRMTLDHIGGKWLLSNVEFVA